MHNSKLYSVAVSSALIDKKVACHWSTTDLYNHNNYSDNKSN